MIFAAAFGLTALIPTLLWALISDLTRFKIPNAIPIIIALAFFPTVFALSWEVGEILRHLAAGGIMLAIGFVLFLRRYLGGGDAKLLAALSLWTGLDILYPFLFSVAVIGGIFALCMLGFRKVTLRSSLQRFAWIERLHQERKHIPYAVAICGGAFVMLRHFPQFSHLFNT